MCNFHHLLCRRQSTFSPLYTYKNFEFSSLCAVTKIGENFPIYKVLFYLYNMPSFYGILLFIVCVDTNDPGVKAFQQCYSTLQNALDSHINIIASSSYSRGLIPGSVNATITCTSHMPSGDKVNKFLSTVEERIAEDHQLVEAFAEILIDQGSYLSVIGNDLEKTYREYFLLHIAFVKLHMQK